MENLKVISVVLRLDRAMTSARDFPAMARREGDRRRLCSVCLKPIAEKALHVRAGIAWFHIKCYEKVKPPPKRRPS